MERWTSGMLRIIVIGFVFAAMTTACGGEDDAVEVSGSTGTCTEVGEESVCDNATYSDSRLEGVLVFTIECDLTENGETTVAECSGPFTRTNDGGTWEGTCEGTSTWSTSKPDHVHVLDCTYLGTGDYEGLRYVEHLEGVDYPWSVTGRIESIE